MPLNFLQDLKALLLFFHVTLQKIIPPLSLVQTLGACDIRCANIVHDVVKENDTKHRKLSVKELAVNMRDQLGQTTATFIEELPVKPSDLSPSGDEEGRTWIKYPDDLYNKKLRSLPRTCRRLVANPQSRQQLTRWQLWSLTG